jgi:3-hydroxymyristoyl/3-hydroxydecanoyl-(acyl carrier protein) dehydratase
MSAEGKPLDPEFVADCPYGPEALLFDRIITIDVPGSRVVASMPVHDDLPLTRHQRVHPVKHPRHVNGGLMVHMTGMLGLLHAYYVFGLRHADGWIGYGAKVHGARFLALAKPGEPLVMSAVTTKVRKGNNIMARYTFEFKQGDVAVYEGDQTAMWMRIDEAHPLPPEPGA